MATNKRPASSTAFASANVPSAKRAAPSGSGSASLTSFFPSKTGPARPPQPIVASDPITDRQSTFIAHAAPCSNHVQAQTLQRHLRHLRTATHPVKCTHEILAWRCLTLKPGKSGLDSEDDFKIAIDGDDDGEKGGATIIKEVLTQEGGVDVAIVISRLYGGVMLGPARFAHMRTVASQALARLLEAQKLPLLLSRLSDLDAEIASHSPAPASPAPASSAAKYAALDVVKAERLVAAREKRLELLKKKQREEEEELWRRVEEQEADDARAATGPGEGEPPAGGAQPSTGAGAGDPDVAASKGDEPADTTGAAAAAAEDDKETKEAAGGLPPSQTEASNGAHTPTEA